MRECALYARSRAKTRENDEETRRRRSSNAVSRLPWDHRSTLGPFAIAARGPQRRARARPREFVSLAISTATTPSIRLQTRLFLAGECRRVQAKAKGAAGAARRAQTRSNARARQTFFTRSSLSHAVVRLDDVDIGRLLHGNRSGARNAVVRTNKRERASQFGVRRE